MQNVDKMQTGDIIKCRRTPGNKTLGVTPSTSIFTAKILRPSPSAAGRWFVECLQGEAYGENVPDKYNYGGGYYRSSSTTNGVKQPFRIVAGTHFTITEKAWRVMEAHETGFAAHAATEAAPKTYQPVHNTTPVNITGAAMRILVLQ